MLHAATTSTKKLVAVTIRVSSVCARPKFERCDAFKQFDNHPVLHDGGIYWVSPLRVAVCDLDELFQGHSGLHQLNNKPGIPQQFLVSSSSKH